MDGAEDGLLDGDADGDIVVLGSDDGNADGAVHVSTIRLRITLFESKLYSTTSKSTPSVLSGCFTTITTPLHPFESSP